jgi:hypothetical protein
MKDLLQVADILTFTKFFSLRLYGHAGKMQNQIITKQLQQLQRKEQGKEEDHIKDEETRLKRI